MPQNPYAQPPSWYEQNLPLMQGLGTLHSSQMRYLTEPTGYPVNPANARARALQDSLAAYYNAIPQQQQMEQRRIQQEQNARLFDLQLKDYERKAEQDKYQRETIRPLTKEQIKLGLRQTEGTLGQQEWERKNLRPEQLKVKQLQRQQEELQLKNQQGRESIRTNWDETVKSFFPDNPVLQNSMADLPNRLGLDGAINYLSSELSTFAKRGTLLSKVRAQELGFPYGTVRLPDNTYSFPADQVLKQRRMQDSGDLKTKIIDDYDEKRALGFSDHAAKMGFAKQEMSQDGVPKLTFHPYPEHALEKRRDEIMREGIDNPEMLASSDYLQEFNRRYLQPQSQIISREDGSIYEVWKSPTPIPSHIKEPTHPDYQKIKKEQEESAVGLQTPREPRLVVKGPSVKKTEQQKLNDLSFDLASARSTLLDYKKLVDSHDTFLGFMPKFGDFRATSKAYALTLQDILLKMKGYGAPQAPELLRLQGYIAAIGEFTDVYWKSAANEKKYILTQIRNYQVALDRHIKKVNDRLQGIGPPIVFGQPPAGTGAGTGGSAGTGTGGSAGTPTGFTGATSRSNMERNIPE